MRYIQSQVNDISKDYVEKKNDNDEAIKELQKHKAVVEGKMPGIEFKVNGFQKEINACVT